MLKVLQKDKNDKWYKDIYENYSLSLGTLSLRDDYQDKLKLYQFFNNDLSQYQQLLHEMCHDVLSQKSAEEQLLSYNKIKNKYDVLHGELLRRGNNHKIMLVTAKAIRSKNEKFLKEINNSVDKDLQLVLQKAQSTLEQMSSKELEKFIQEERQMLTPKDINYKNFLSDYEIYKNKMLKHIYIQDDILSKKAQTFKQQFIGAEFYVKNSWTHGKPTIDVLNPLYCRYLVSGNEEKVSKNDWFQYADEITIGEALDEYINALSLTDVEKIIDNYGNLGIPDKSHLTTILHNYNQFHLQKALSNNQYDGRLWGLSEARNSYPTLWSSFIRRTHMEFKAYDEMLFYTYTDEYNDPITIILENNASIIPDNASELDYVNEYHQKDKKYVWSKNGVNHEVRVKWIPQRYEMTSLGPDMLINKRKVPFQPQRSENPISGYTSSYKGIVVNNMNSKAHSRMEAAIPSQLQILALKELQNKEIAKYKGFVMGRDISQMPIELGNDSDKPEDVITNISVIEKKTGESYFNSNNTQNGIYNPQKGAPLIPMQMGDPNSFLIIQSAINALDQEVGLACGVPPQREGQSVQGTNVTDNQQVLVQTTLATEHDFYEHGKVWTEALNESLDSWDTYFKNYFDKNPDAKETFLEHALPNNSKDLIKVIPEFTEMSGIGVYLQDTYSDKEYKDMMRMKIQQNTNEIDMESLSAITKSISSGASMEEIHREVELLMQKAQERVQQQQEAEAKFNKEREDAQRSLMKYQSDLRVGEALEINNAQELTKLKLGALEVDKFRLQNDVDKNNVADTIQLDREKRADEATEKEKDRQHEKELKEKDIEGKLKIEKVKPKPTVKA